MENRIGWSVFRRRTPYGVLLSMLLSILYGCLSSAPPYLGSGDSAPVNGAWIAHGGDASFQRWGAECGFRVDRTSLELRRGADTLVVDDAVPPDGLLFKAEGDAGAIVFDMGAGRRVTWLDNYIDVGDSNYYFGSDTRVRLPPNEVVFEGHLAPGQVFAWGSLWMSAVGRDLELQRGDWRVLLQDVVADPGIRFRVRSFALPQVTFETQDGTRISWIRDQVEFGGRILDIE